MTFHNAAEETFEFMGDIYLWKEVLTPTSLLDIIENFVLFTHLSDYKWSDSKQKVIDLLASNDRVSLTEHHSTNEVFSFGRDQGLYGRILNQTVIVEDSINVRNDHEVSGFCFTPQDGNSILSSIAATVRFLNPHSYQDKINSLGRFFFDRV